MKFDLEVSVRRPSGFSLEVSFHCETMSLGIVGPSGSGKSTLLNAIAGIEPCGKVVLDGTDFSNTALHLRRTGYVTQDPLLFPHLTVRENIGYSPSSGPADDVVSALGMADLLDRMPRYLSGGEQRRVALARAVASRPAILLLDEPFAGLDEDRRREAMSLLESVQRRFNIPMVLVSHRAEDVIGLTACSLRLESGKATIAGPSSSVLRSGETKIDNYMTGIVTARNRVKVSGVELAVALPYEMEGEVRLACYAHDIILATDILTGISARNCFWSVIDSIEPAGNALLITLTSPRLRVLVTQEAVEALHLGPGARVAAVIKATSIAFLGKQ